MVKYVVGILTAVALYCATAQATFAQDFFLGTFVASSCGEKVIVYNNESERSGTDVHFKNTSTGAELVIHEVESAAGKVSTGNIPSAWAGATVEVYSSNSTTGIPSVEFKDISKTCPETPTPETPTPETPTPETPTPETPTPETPTPETPTPETPTPETPTPETPTPETPTPETPTPETPTPETPTPETPTPETPTPETPTPETPTPETPTPICADPNDIDPRTGRPCVEIPQFYPELDITAVGYCKVQGDQTFAYFNVSVKQGQVVEAALTVNGIKKDPFFSVDAHEPTNKYLPNPLQFEITPGGSVQLHVVGTGYRAYKLISIDSNIVTDDCRPVNPPTIDQEPQPEPEQAPIPESPPVQARLPRTAGEETNSINTIAIFAFVLFIAGVFVIRLLKKEVEA